MLAMDDHNTEEAEHWFRRAVHLKQDFRSALFNLALLLADDHRPLEAAPFLNQLVKYHPDHIKGLILLGDIYINNIKDLDAAENVSTSDIYIIATCCLKNNLFCFLFLLFFT
jgi:protein O-mannosyl-transferase